MLCDSVSRNTRFERILARLPQHVDHPAQRPDLAKRLRAKQQFLAAGAGTHDVERGEDAALRKA